MPKGGARVTSGPAPDPNALRRSRDVGEWTTLPAEGREGEPPTWPLSRRGAREKVLWDALWKKPQAIMWERFGQEVEVALYVRRLAESEQPGSAVNLGTLVRQMSDSLGLSTPGMRNNRWRIAGDEVAARRAGSEAPAPRKSSRDRLRVVNGGEV